MTQTLVTPAVDLDVLRRAIQDEYAVVAQVLCATRTIHSIASSRKR